MEKAQYAVIDVHTMKPATGELEGKILRRLDSAAAAHSAADSIAVAHTAIPVEQRRSKVDAYACRIISESEPLAKGQMVDKAGRDIDYRE